MYLYIQAFNMNSLLSLCKIELINCSTWIVAVFSLDLVNREIFVKLFMQRNFGNKRMNTLQGIYD